MVGSYWEALFLLLFSKRYSQCCLYSELPGAYIMPGALMLVVGCVCERSKCRFLTPTGSEGNIDCHLLSHH